MIYLLYFAIALFATTLGALTGMGGGVIIKPSLDMLGHFDVSSISMLSSITAFTMSLVSIFRQRKSTDMPNASISVPIAIGAVIGGNLGSLMLDSFLDGSADKSQVTVVQNIILAFIIVLVCVYMFTKDKITSPRLKGIVPSALVGLLLGIVSSFLGIGGGPFNVALIIFIFGFTTKTAALCSLITILFSQGSKLVTTLFTGGFGGYELSVLPVMLIAAVLGGMIGGAVHKRINEKTADKLFNSAQIVVLSMCVINILRNI